jgi:hypothetical protein
MVDAPPLSPPGRYPRALITGWVQIRSVLAALCAELAIMTSSAGSAIVAGAPPQRPPA